MHISPLNFVHKTGKFGDYSSKNDNDLLKVSEVNKLLIFQIAKFTNSNFDISNIHVDELNLPSSLKSSSNSNTRILWLGPNNWLVFSSNLNLIEKEKKNATNFIIPTISALNHISTFVLAEEEQINFWQTGRAIKIDINYLKKSKTFDYKKPIKVIDKRKKLLGIGFLNEDKTNINPKLVLNAK